MRLGIFGGSFDPIHYGHLILAEACREQQALGEVWFVPASDPPHKRGELHASGLQRAEMIELAVADNDAFSVSRLELRRGGVSYTIDTLERMAKEHPHAERYLLMGADSLADLPNWREPARICELAVPLVVRRTTAPQPDYGVLESLCGAERTEQIRSHQVTMPLIELSSTEIRKQISAGRSVQYQTPPPVIEYVREHNLYCPAKT